MTIEKNRSVDAVDSDADIYGDTIEFDFTKNKYHYLLEGMSNEN